MALSVLLALVCLVCNVEAAMACIRGHVGAGLGDTIGGLLGDVRVYLLMMEGVVLIVVLVDALRKYPKYKSEVAEAVNSSW